MNSFVSVLCLHEYEIAAAEEELGDEGKTMAADNVLVEGRYRSGYLSDAAIARLTEKGIIVEEIELAPAPAPYFADELPRPNDVEVLSDDSTAPAALPVERFVVDLWRPFGEPERTLLASKGAEIDRQFSSTRFVVKATLEQAHALREANELVQHVSCYGIEATLSAEQFALVQNAALAGGSGADGSGQIYVPGGADDDFEILADEFDEPSQPAAPASRVIHIVCHPEADVAAFAAELQTMPGVSNIDFFGQRVRCDLVGGEVGTSTLDAIGAMKATRDTEDYVQPDILIEFAVPGLQRLAPAAAAVPLPFRGKDQTLVISDTGLDSQHPDFGPRFNVVEMAVPASPRDPHGHGSHVASIAAGSGAASGGKLTGVAPEAKVHFQSLASNGMALEGAKLGLLKLLEDGYATGAKVHNLSWGSNVGAGYVLNSEELDSFVRDHPDYLVIVAAGNTGNQDRDSADGTFALESLYAPATAKNCLTVGACCSPRADGPFADRTWKSFPGKDPPAFPPMSDEPLTGTTDIIAALSSRGPSHGGRIKPDLLAPGIGIAAARSGDSDNPGRIPYDPDSEHYIYLSGTSMAAPMVAGAALLLREYLVGQDVTNPSAALMKAILVNGAVRIDRQLGLGSDVGTPDFHQGFGRLVLERAFPIDAAAGFRLLLADVANGGTGAVTRTSDPWTRRFTVRSPGQPLSLTIAWTDTAGPGAANLLDFLVIAPGEQAKLPGNNHLQRDTGKLVFDRFNNVQKVRIEAPAAGDWKVLVAGKVVPKSAQGFGLAVTGDISDWL